jgi:hypothetical protein
MRYLGRQPVFLREAIDNRPFFFSRQRLPSDLDNAFHQADMPRLYGRGIGTHPINTVVARAIRPAPWHFGVEIFEKKTERLYAR